MNSVYKPQTLEEVQELDLALDDYIVGINEATMALESIDRFRHALISTKGDISQSSFKLVQTFINGTQKHLQIPNETKTTLEYYNNRPLKELALEGLGSIFKTIIDAIKATFKFIIDGIKSIFGIHSSKKEEKYKEDVKEMPEKAKETLLEIQKNSKGEIKKYINQSATFFGSEVALIHAKIMLSHFKTEQALEILMDSPKRVSNMLKHTVDFIKELDVDKEDNHSIRRLEDALDKVRATINGLKPPPSTMSKLVTLSGDGIKYIDFVADYRGLAVNADGKCQEVIDSSKKPSSEVNVAIFKSVDEVAKSEDSLNKVAAKYIEVVNSASKEIDQFSKALVSKLESSTISKTNDEKKLTEVYKLIKEVNMVSLNYIKFFAKTYTIACLVREKTANILLKK